MPNRDLKHRVTFENESETYVRTLAERIGPIGIEARAYLGELQVKREEEFAAMRDEREERTLAIAEEANRIASSALATSNSQARWAKWAAIIAITALIVSSKVAIFSAVSMLIK